MGGKRNYGKLTPFAAVRENYNSDKNTRHERLTQAKLAKELNVSSSTICRIERGEIQPHQDILQGYVDFFDVSADFFIGTTPPTQSNSKTRAYRELGLSDSTVKTLQMIEEYSSGATDLSALLNAFLGGKEHTVLLFQNLLTYLKDLDTNTPLAEHFFVEALKLYLHNVVRPQVQTTIKNSKREDAFLASIPDEINYGDN